MSALTANPSRFIFFGCWNNMNDKSNLKNTMATLDEYLKENPRINLVVVGGDNFYPDKSKKKEQKDKDKKDKGDIKPKKVKEEGKEEKKCTKIINLDKLSNGFNLLPKKIPILMLLGNHDLDTNAINEEKFCIVNGENTIPEPPNQCAILQHEKYLVNLPLHRNITFGTNFVSRSNNTLLLMIDTSMYDSIESESYIECYKKHRNQSSDQTSTDTYIQELRIIQNAWILNEIKIGKQSGINNIIIMGHHPITGYKVKDDMCILTKLEQPFVDMWMGVLDIIDPTIHIHYLCADIHNNQESIIIFDSYSNKPINQHIVGTGGTELDAKEHINCPSNISSENNTISYILKSFVNAHHGFLDCDCSGERPTFTFVPTINQMKTAEGKKKRNTKKYKNTRSKKITRKSKSKK